jgi:NADPH:quinone reductase-like Zn-dependent oxidoreductase
VTTACQAHDELGQITQRRLTMHGSGLGGRTRSNRAKLVDGHRTAIMPHVARGSIEPAVRHIMTIQNVVHAHRLMEAGRTFGTILLTVEQATDRTSRIAGGIACVSAASASTGPGAR